MTLLAKHFLVFPGINFNNMMLAAHECGLEYNLKEVLGFIEGHFAFELFSSVESGNVGNAEAEPYFCLNAVLTGFGIDGNGFTMTDFGDLFTVKGQFHGLGCDHEIGFTDEVDAAGICQKVCL